MKTKKQVLSFQTLRSRKERKLLLILRVNLEIVVTKCRQSPGLFVFPRPQAGQVFWLNLVHVWKARCVTTGPFLLLAPWFLALMRILAFSLSGTSRTMLVEMELVSDQRFSALVFLGLLVTVRLILVVVSLLFSCSLLELLHVSLVLLVTVRLILMVLVLFGLSASILVVFLGLLVTVRLILMVLAVVSQIFHLFRIHLILLIHVLVRRHLHVHVFLALLVLVLLLVFALSRHLLRSLLLLHIRMLRRCTVRVPPGLT